MCRMNLIQDAWKKSDQLDVSKLLVSQLSWSSSDHHSPGHLLNCTSIFCWHRGWSPTFVLPHIWELLFLYAGAAQGTALLLCSSARLAEWVLSEHLHLWKECSASHPGL